MRALLPALVIGLLLFGRPDPAAAQGASTTGAAPAANLRADDVTNFARHAVRLRWDIQRRKGVRGYELQRSAQRGGAFALVASLPPTAEVHVDVLPDGEGEAAPAASYFYRLVAVSADGSRSPPLEIAEAVQPKRGAIARFQAATSGVFDWSRGWFMVVTIFICAAVIFWIFHARSGKELKIRKIPGLEALDEAVGRATEMGRSVLYIPGIQDMNDIQTIAGISILSRVAKMAAEFDAKVEVPTARSLVMTTARETVQAAHLAAGRPDSYNEDAIYYVTDEQFGYVAYLSGMMVREKPAACFYMGAFYAESLLLAETGNSIGAIQVAGTAMPAQLPFFVAACDYTLIGEEFFAASAYLSGSPEELGSLKGQDVGKVLVAAILLVGCGVATLASVTGADVFRDALDFITGSLLT